MSYPKIVSRIFLQTHKEQDILKYKFYLKKWNFDIKDSIYSLIYTKWRSYKNRNIALTCYSYFNLTQYQEIVFSFYIPIINEKYVE